MALETSIETFIKSFSGFGNKKDREMIIKCVIRDTVWSFNDLAKALGL